MGTPQPLFISVNGTGCPGPFDPGFSGDIGRWLTNPWWNIASQFLGPAALGPYNVYWQPIGYPAAVMGMTKSVNTGVAEVSWQIALHENPSNPGYCPPGFPLFLSGYSQGALVTDVFWRDFVLSPTGLHHNRLDDIVGRGGIINFGDPMRCPGIAHGNEVAGFPAPEPLDGVITGGIAGPKDLTPEQTPPCLLSCALDGDLYAAAPVGPPEGTTVTDSGPPWTKEPLVGQVETRIYDFIESGSIVTGLLAVAKGISQEFEYPLTNTIALVHAIVNGMTFAAAGTAAPHWQYGPFVPYMVNWILGRVGVEMAA